MKNGVAYKKKCVSMICVIVYVVECGQTSKPLYFDVFKSLVYECYLRSISLKLH